MRGNQVSLHVQTGERITTTRAAVVVSKKVDKSAVRRNRIRRRVYEIFRTHHSQLKGPANLVFTVYNPDFTTMPAEEVQTAVLSLLKSAKLL